MNKPVSEPWSGSGKPPLPKLGDPLLLYKSSKIYISASKLEFRVIREAKLYATELSIKFAGTKPDSKTWAAALKACDTFDFKAWQAEYAVRQKARAAKAKAKASKQ